MGFGGGGGGGGGVSFSQGLDAARPVSPAANALWFSTDSGEWWVATAAGGAWQSIAKTSATILRVSSTGMGIGNVSGNQGLDFGGNGNIQWVGTGIKGFNKALLAVGGFGAVEGANAKQGTIGAMTAGTITVANTSVTANSKVYPMRGPGGTNPGAWYCSAIVAGTSFTVTSTNAADTGSGWFEIFEPA